LWLRVDKQGVPARRVLGLPNFHLCSCGEFSRRRLDELNGALEVMKRLRTVFAKRNQAMAETAGYRRRRSGSVFKSPMSMAEIREQMKLDTRILKPSIDTMSTDELALLTMGLYFSNDPSTIEDLVVFQKWERDQLIEKILGKSHLFEPALAGLVSHRHRVEKFKNAKNQRAQRPMRPLGNKRPHP
jgi:hypothetical protein